MKTPSPPTPPDPKVTASAQTATNIGTAVANTAGGLINQVGPDGSLTYSKRGEHEYTDPHTGQVHIVPQYTATTTLTPEGQEIFDLGQSAQKGLAETADKSANMLADYIGNVDPLDTEATEKRLFELGSARLDPRFDREEDRLRTNLLNRGIREGSRAWDAEMGDFSKSRNDAYNSLMLTGRGQARAEAEADRARPINEITALLSGSQVNVPNYNIASPANAATTDYAGLVSDNYRQRYANYQTEVNNRNSMIGGLFGLGSGLLRGGMAFI